MHLDDDNEYGIPDEENPEWTKEMFARAVRLHDLPPNVQKTLRAIQDSRKQPSKVEVTIRLSKDVVDELRESGTGWQSRVDEALRTWLKQQKEEAVRKAS